MKMRIDEIARQSLLFDFYGQLLPPRQRQVMELYTEENLSLLEIADQFDISRQGVHDALRKAQKALTEYEEKLGLVDRFLETEEAVSTIDQQIGRMVSDIENGRMQEKEQEKEIVQRLAGIREIIDRLRES